MNATSTGLTAGVRRIRGIALALLLLALLAGAAAGYLIRAVSTTSTVTIVRNAPAAASSGHAQYPVGEGHQWSAPAVAPSGAEQVPVGDGHQL